MGWKCCVVENGLLQCVSWLWKVDCPCTFTSVLCLFWIVVDFYHNGKVTRWMSEIWCIFAFVLNWCALIFSLLLDWVLVVYGCCRASQGYLKNCAGYWCVCCYCMLLLILNRLLVVMVMVEPGCIGCAIDTGFECLPYYEFGPLFMWLLQIRTLMDARWISRHLFFFGVVWLLK